MRNYVLPAALVIGALLACKRPGPQPQNPQQSSTPATDAGADDAAPSDAALSDAMPGDAPATAAPSGPRLTFECDGDERGCYDRARTECGGPFNELEKVQRPSQISKPPPRAGKPAVDILKPKITAHNAAPPMMHTTLTVMCTTAGASAPASTLAPPPSDAGAAAPSAAAPSAAPPSAAPPSLAPAKPAAVDGGR
jgi:hypothetical protein